MIEWLYHAIFWKYAYPLSIALIRINLIRILINDDNLIMITKNKACIRANYLTQLKYPSLKYEWSNIYVYIINVYDKEKLFSPISNLRSNLFRIALPKMKQPTGSSW